MVDWLGLESQAYGSCNLKYGKSMQKKGFRLVLFRCNSAITLSRSQPTTRSHCCSFSFAIFSSEQCGFGLWSVSRYFFWTQAQPQRNPKKHPSHDARSLASLGIRQGSAVSSNSLTKGSKLSSGIHVIPDSLMITTYREI